MDISKLFHLVVLQALALGFVFAPRAAAARHPAATKRAPVIIFPYSQGAGPTIVPNDGGTTLEYRRVLYKGGGADR